MDGGDTNKIKNYWVELEKLGVECHYLHNVYDEDIFKEYDIIHIFHLGHSFSHKFYLEAVRSDKPIVISPIYFPNQDNPIQYRQEMLGYSSATLYLSEGEKSQVAKLFENFRGLEERSFIVPNGVGDEFVVDGYKYEHPNRPEEEYVLCVGRLCSRKNQANLAQACMELDIPLLLIGEPADNLVTRACQAIADKWEGLWWEGPVPHELLADAYRGAKVLACPSTLEMWPNVVAEGGLSGCNLVVGTGSMSFTDIDGVYTCDKTIDSIKEAVASAYSDDRDESLVGYFSEFTWEKSAAKLKEAYDYAIKNPILPTYKV